MDSKAVTWYVLRPDGQEVELGQYKTEVAAKRAFSRKVAADYRALCTGPYRKDPA